MPPSYLLDVVNRIGIYVIAALGLNILTGFTGLISLGNAAFMAIGASLRPGLPCGPVSLLFSASPWPD